MKHLLTAAFLLLAFAGFAQFPKDPGTGPGAWVDSALVAERVTIINGIAYLPPEKGLEIGEFLAFIPEGVGVIELAPGATYNAFRVRHVKLPRRDFTIRGNGATLRLHPGGIMATPYPEDMTDANALTHYRYRIQDLIVVSGDVGLWMSATNHAVVEGVQFEGQAMSGVRTEMALSTTFRNCKVTHCSGVSYLFTFGRWPRGGRYRAPTNKVVANTCEAYVAKADAIGFVLDNVEGGVLTDCTVQGSASLHDVVVSMTGEDDVFSAAEQMTVGNSSVAQNATIERLYIEGHFAAKGSVYVNVPLNGTVRVVQPKFHGSYGVPFVVAGGWLHVIEAGWAPPHATIRTKTANPHIRFSSCWRDWSSLPLLNMHRIDEPGPINTTAVQHLWQKWDR